MCPGYTNCLYRMSNPVFPFSLLQLI
uniref:Uncharacterized protein n=1 Tax=Anguilla anguilla TaxID=7936 RepID=A0A0E9U155_ANGAN